MRNPCAIRLDATTFPSPSAASAFTDDVPMSIPTVTSFPAPRRSLFPAPRRSLTALDQ